MQAILLAFMVGFLLGGLSSFFVYNERDISSTKIIRRLAEEKASLIKRLKKYEGDDKEWNYILIANLQVNIKIQHL